MAKLSSTHIYGDLYVDGTISGALSGNASTATTLQTARTINGTSFNGSANITTANWGTSRTITIGSTGKSVNGSGNVSWTLAEIGAAAGNHTHNYAGSSSSGGAANSVKTNLIIKLNGGSTEGTNLFTFNGGTAKTVNITPSAIGAAASSHGTHLSLGTTSSTAYRGDYGNTAYTHSQAAHAPSNAQKNSDITKAEIEAKLTGTVTSHNHSGTYAPASHNHTSLTGITSLTFDANSDDSSVIKITKDGTISYTDFIMSDDVSSDMWRWRFKAWDSAASASTAEFNLMTLKASSTTKGQLSVNGNVTADSFTEGGTALSSKYAASSHSHNFFNVKGNNTINSTSNDNTTNWGNHGNSVHFYTASGQLIDQPNTWGFLLNIGKTSEVHQIWMTQASGDMYHRGGNASGWSGSWRKLLDSSNYSSHALPLVGGIVTGNLVVNGNIATKTGAFTYAKEIGAATSDGSTFLAVLRYGSSRGICDLGTNSIPGRLFIRSGQGTAGSGVSIECAVTNGTNYLQYVSPESGTIALTKHLSDRTKKENIVYIDSEESEFNTKDFYNFIKDDLDLATYNLKKEYAATDTHTKLNFIAQDLLWDFEKNKENKVGNLIVQAEDAMEQQLSLKYDPEVFTSVIAGALKESINKIEELEDKNKKLEERLAMLEEKFSTLENK